MKIEIGTKMLVHNDFLGKGTDTIAEVVAITPTGRFKLAKFNTQFNADGKALGSDHIATIATEEDIERVRKMKFIKEVAADLQFIDYTDLTYEQAEAIRNILANNKEVK